MSNTNKLKIGACVMVHNMAGYIPACVSSLYWVDSIYIYDDHSNDDGIEVAIRYASCPVIFEKSTDEKLVFEKGELEVRNQIIDKAFAALGADILIILDADEMLSSSIEPIIRQAFLNTEIDSINFSIWHLYDQDRYIHFWETKINGVNLIDPHTRVVRKGKYFQPLFGDGSHPILQADKNTFCIHGPYHFHLKYFYKSKLPNYSLFFLPERITEDDVAPYLRELPFEMPVDIKNALSLVDWDSMPLYDQTPHYSSDRIKYKDVNDALIHPKDRI